MSQNFSATSSKSFVQLSHFKMQCPTNNIERVHVDITVLPSCPPPQPVIGPTIPPKLLAIMQKYKYNWRLSQLSQPKRITEKYEPKDDFLRQKLKTPVKLKDDVKFFADQLGWPKLRTLYINKSAYGHFKGYKKKYNKTINKAWGSIYNYYKKKARDRRLRELRRQQKMKGKKPTINLKRYDELSKPKPVFKPEPEKKPSKLFTNFDRLDELASPKPYHIEPPKSLHVPPAALAYEPTEIILRLAKLPDRFLNQPKPLEPGKVKRNALRYKATPRIETLAQPKQRSEKSKEDEEVDPWAISKNALKYKPTPRIMELAKAVERD